MSILSLRLPDSLHKRVRELAQQEGISINQFISTAVSEPQYPTKPLPGAGRSAESGDRES